jgi:hypothetical protein
VEAAARAGMKEMPVFTDGNMIQVRPNALLREFEVEGESGTQGTGERVKYNQLHRRGGARGEAKRRRASHEQPKGDNTGWTSAALH